MSMLSHSVRLLGLLSITEALQQSVGSINVHEEELSSTAHKELRNCEQFPTVFTWRLDSQFISLAMLGCNLMMYTV